jgi:hypothetical protein
MASVGSLTVEIAANIASLRTGIEEANSRVASMEKQMSKTSAKMQSSFEGSIAGIRTAWIAGAAAIYTSMAVIQKGWQLANSAAGYQEQSDMLDGLASKYDTTAQSIVESIQTATSGQVNKIEAMNIALSGLAKGLSPDKIIALANASEVLGDTVGETATQAFAKLSEAIITGRTKAILPYLGETAKLKIAHDETGKTIKDAMKSGDMYNLTIAKATSLQKELGDAAESTADKMAAFKADIDDLKLSIGQGLVAGGATAIATFELMAGAIFKVVEAKNRLVAIGLEGLPARNEDYDRAVSNAKLASEQADILFGKTKKNLELADRYWELMQGGSAASGKPVSSMGKVAANEDIALMADVNRKALASFKTMNDSKIKIAEEISNREIALVKATESDKLISMSKTYEIEKQQMLNKRAALESEVASLVKLKASNQDILKVKGDIALLDEQMKTKKQSFDIEYNQEKYKIQLSDMKTFNDNKLKLMDEASKREESIIKVTEDSKTNQFNRTFQLESVFLNDSLQSKASQIQAMLELENAYNDAVRTERLKSINETYDLEKALLETNRANLEAQIPALEQIKGSHDEILKVKNDIALLDEQLYTLEQSYITDVLDVQDSKLNDILSKYISLNEQAQSLMQNIANTAISNIPIIGGDVSGLMGAMSDLDSLQANLDEQKSIYKQALDDIIGYDEDAQAQRLAINTLSAKNIAAMEKSITLQKVNITAMGFNSMANLARAFYDASGQQNEAAFAAYKALMAATTVVSTAAGIMQVWASPELGYWAKWAASGALALTGAAQLATIMNTSPGTTASITTPSGTASVVSPTTTNETATQTEASRSVTYNITVEGNIIDHDKFARELMYALRKAEEDRV